MKNFKDIVFFGALWGLAEATLGFLLHLVVVPITGLFMFPIGFFLMRQVRLKTGSRTSPAQIAVIAAAIKLVNLFFTPLWIDVVNPAVAILLEGVFVAILLSKTEEETLPRMVGATYGWRLSYIAMLSVQALSGLKIRLFAAGLTKVIQYVTIDALANVALVFLIAKFSPKWEFEIKPSMAGATALAAVIATVVI
jgi:hypothetical protein